MNSIFSTDTSIFSWFLLQSSHNYYLDIFSIFLTLQSSHKCLSLSPHLTNSILELTVKVSLYLQSFYLSYFHQIERDSRVATYLKKELHSIYSKEKTLRERLWKNGVVKSSPLPPRKSPEYICTEEVHTVPTCPSDSSLMLFM